ncbi:D-glycero-alpha-D-manno-heptose-1,7-bisphosphate 7-phosphatase [Agromyces salentinus]|uniref:D,D-heptose 1,7-bisphosphate phosphatase n=1 Tax=Agromyces salentinus TaxID=269421 RepID=A0ABN2MXV0_9MICO|nr:HAD-IIIA family hydrolase [Agromyces salentinus]
MKTWRPRTVLFDRDGTLIRDVPYNGDPDLVEAMPTAHAAIQSLRERDVAVGVVTNQSGVARGLLSRSDVDRVNRRVDELLGPMDVWAVCVHGPDDHCGCRKPAPGLIVSALAALGVRPADAAVIGDIGSDVAAAAAAGCRAVLIPTPATRQAEVRDAPALAETLLDAVDLLHALEPVR